MPEAKVHDTRIRRYSSSGLAFCGATALVVVYALRGDSYDIIVRQECGLAIWCVAGWVRLRPASREP